jgi:hypothetical protein
MTVMTTRIAVLLMAGVVCMSAAQAQDKKATEKQAPTQQDRMASCNQNAKEKNLTGDARMNFMKVCLSGKPAVAASVPQMTSQQQKMAKCNSTAKSKELAGTEREAFMSSCLKG